MMEATRMPAGAESAAIETVLINDTFEGHEANDVVQALIDAAVNFQKVENLRSIIGIDKPDTEATRLINELLAARKRLRDQITEARLSGQKVRVVSELKVELSEN